MIIDTTFACTICLVLNSIQVLYIIAGSHATSKTQVAEKAQMVHTVVYVQHTLRAMYLAQVLVSYIQLLSYNIIIIITCLMKLKVVHKCTAK